MTKIEIAKMAAAINKSPFEENQVKNPMELIENDIRNLMKKYYSLSQEFDDYKNKTEVSTKKIFLRFIEVADDIENILNNSSSETNEENRQTKDLISNFQLVLKKLLRELKECGVMPIPVTAGEKVDPNRHNVVEIVEENGKEDGIIIEEIKKGYMWENKLLRVADVKVIKNNEN